MQVFRIPCTQLISTAGTISHPELLPGRDRLEHPGNRVVIGERQRGNTRLGRFRNYLRGGKLAIGMCGARLKLDEGHAAEPNYGPVGGGGEIRRDTQASEASCPGRVCLRPLAANLK